MERTKKYQWHKIAESVAEIGFEGNGIKEVLVNNKKACIVLHNNNLSACAQKCPHAGGNLQMDMWMCREILYALCTGINSVCKMAEI